LRASPWRRDARHDRAAAGRGSRRKAGRHAVRPGALGRGARRAPLPGRRRDPARCVHRARAQGGTWGARHRRRARAIPGGGPRPVCRIQPMGKGRFEAFSDGVIAVIITVMVLELKVPHGEDLDALVPLVPVFLTYVLSFIYVGIYWNNHHHMIHAITRVNGPILWANLH